MSKIICDICGTSYPETSTQCPICGCVRPGNIGAVNGSNNGQKSQGSYQYVKGGRFSKANVKKRNQGKVYAPDNSDSSGGRRNANKGLIIAIILLFIAIAAVGAYIVLTLLSSGDDTTETQPIGGNIATAATQGQNGTVESTPSVGTCEKIEVTKKKEKYTFEKAAGDGVVLDIVKTPADCNEPLECQTSDELVAVAEVTEHGRVKITAVGYGEAIITIKCGNAEEVTIPVECTFGKSEEPTEPTDPVEPDLTFELKTWTGDLDIMFFSKGESSNIYAGTVPVDQIEWSSDDEKVATFKNGVVTATGVGTTDVHAKYGDTVITCKVRCDSSVGPYVPPVVEAPPVEEKPEYEISATSKTIVVNEEFTLVLMDKNGKIMDVSWTVDTTGICTIAGNQIRGVGEGIVIISTEHDGVPYACTVEVKAAS